MTPGKRFMETEYEKTEHEKGRDFLITYDICYICCHNNMKENCKYMKSYANIYFDFFAGTVSICETAKHLSVKLHHDQCMSKKEI